MTDTMAAKTTKHVVYHDGSWVIKTQDRPVSKSARVYATQLEAVRNARSLAKRSGSDLVIHGRDGRIRDVDSYTRKALVSRLLPTHQ